MFEKKQDTRNKKQEGQARTLVSSSRAGFAVLFAALVGALALAIGLAVFNITVRELILSSQARESQAAFYSADAGMECGLYWDRQHAGLSASPFGDFSDIIDDGLEGYWKLDESSGLIANDSSGNSHTGALQANMTDSDWVAGEVNNGLDFDGVDDFVNVGSAEGLDNISTITVMAWVNANTAGEDSEGYIVSKSGNSYSGNWTLGVCNAASASGICEGVSGGHVIFTHDRTTGNLGAWTVPGSGGWHHIAVTYDNSSTANDPVMYIDGNIVTEVERRLPEGDPQIINVRSVCVGNRSDTSGGCGTNKTFDGVIDEVRIYTRILSESEIQDIHAQTEQEFIVPIGQGDVPDTLYCAGEDINSTANNWTIVEQASNAATTTFDVGFEGEQCAKVVVNKDSGNTRIESRGYNTCNTDDPRRVERGLRATY